jgi:tRNA-splicing ligase RtcB (3'-phosphate/5'-hydroxy nucleic acid ligase)
MPPSDLRKIADTLWEIPPSHKEGMRVPARVYADEQLIRQMDDGVFEQVSNVASLPGIVDHALCMPDGHWGYGFPIGGVAAFDLEDGVISPGGIGFDINCGMRLVRTDLTEEELRPNLERLVDGLFARVPAGVGAKGFVNVSRDEFREVVEQGMDWCLRKGYATRDDLDATEDHGRATAADASAVSERAVERGIGQVGTLGSGNHYLEIQVARKKHVFDEDLARAMGLDRDNQVFIMLHTGSRGFGHQVASEYLKEFLRVMESTYRIPIRDRELACAPIRSPEGERYFKAMSCAINMAFVNRQVMLHRIREVFSDVLHRDPEDLGIRQVYDVTHNTAKEEQHRVGEELRQLLVHRKGATRAFGPHTPGLPERYRHVGQPVIIGGSMETGSYLLCGTAEGEGSFFTTAHGSGRTMGRRQAQKRFRGDVIRRQLREQGIYIRSVSDKGLAEEAGGAYKNIDAIAAVAERAGLSRRVVKLVPIGNIKG